MIGSCDYESPDHPDQAESDRAAYLAEYGMPINDKGQSLYSPAKVVRFMVEVCGISYNEALEAVVEDMRSWPSGCHNGDPDAAVRSIVGSRPNIIEALFDLKVLRMVREDEPAAIEDNWMVTRRLMGTAYSAGTNRDRLGQPATVLPEVTQG